MSGKTLRMKDLFEVKFTAINDRSSKAVIVKQVNIDISSRNISCVISIMLEHGEFVRYRIEILMFLLKF